MATREQVLRAAEYVNKAGAIDSLLDARYANIVLSAYDTFGRMRETSRLDYYLVTSVEALEKEKVTTESRIISSAVVKALKELKAHYLQLAGVEE